MSHPPCLLPTNQTDDHAPAWKMVDRVERRWRRGFLRPSEDKMAVLLREDLCQHFRGPVTLNIGHGLSSSAKLRDRGWGMG